MNELAQIRELPLRDYHRKSRKQYVYVGQGEVALRRWDSWDVKDMQTFFGIMHRRAVKQNFDFSGTTARGFGREFHVKEKNPNDYNFAVSYGLKHPYGSKGEADAFVYFHFDADDRREYERIVSYGVLPQLKGQKVFEVGYAKSKTAPAHFTNRGLMQACQVMNRMLGIDNLSFEEQKELQVARDSQRPSRYTVDELSKLTPAERVLLDSPIDMIIYAWVGENERRIPQSKSGKTKRIFIRNEASEELARNSGFVEVGRVPDDEMPGAYLHIYLLDWRKLQQKMHERADKYFLEMVGSGKYRAKDIDK